MRPGGTRSAAAGDEERVLEHGRLAVREGLAIEGLDGAAGGGEDGVAGGGVPFHGAAEARVEVGLAGGDKAELERAAGRGQLLDRVLGQVFIGLGVAVERLATTTRPSAAGRRTAIGLASPRSPSASTC